MSARLCESKGLHQKILKLTGKLSLPVRIPGHSSVGQQGGKHCEGNVPEASKVF